jgi:hypothetical protein
MEGVKLEDKIISYKLIELAYLIKISYKLVKINYNLMKKMLPNKSFFQTNL